MFDGLFKSARALARHQDAPFAAERARYIKYCVERGSTALTLALKCRELLWAARLLDGESRLVFNKEAFPCASRVRSIVRCCYPQPATCRDSFSGEIHWPSQSRTSRLEY